ncbi:hypothetical protein V6Z11_D03G067400 [Gossypium hirsutum]|uniref:Gamma aminobutyrate transaminase 1, mitochondrial-like n=1 Tax=Gossypium hirsutum TaxID=3635 RepID=A0A1U8NQ15_GOSHI|nr:gamma aminobutyrate transaminase 1, mitochondrial isoform X1 [Gossypium hirsutum]XP_016741077.1 gamma aminobutyrate transaminase 1, mitochondrial isoform X1 [Gossypium hirsutum]XP_016741078.1 gamma aminobutyrate transaminase 1, mitochondrial isoform X1 [Gossypium hirsutum]
MLLIFIECPHYWRYHLPGETKEDFSTRLANNLENLILKEGPETIAVFIAEPVMGAGGVIPPPATYFEKVQAVVKRYDILFIANEVISAFGRLGTMFGYIPIGAVMVSPQVTEVVYSRSNKLGNFSRGFTYTT